MTGNLTQPGDTTYLQDMPDSRRRPRFPPASSADRDGLLMVGGELSPEWLLAAYRTGIFPWPIVERDFELLAWFSPDPRAIIELDGLHVSRRLARRLRSGQFQVTIDRDFAGVMQGCAGPRGRDWGTWITPAVRAAYLQMHALGYAHSIEVWSDQRLVGGLYGIGIGGMFAGESMFHLVTDASKVALACLVEHLQARAYALFDIQQTTAHSQSMGSIEIPRREFLRRVELAVELPVDFGRELAPRPRA